ncbi:MAG TPA: alpha/beta fold hydrolase, partial [Acidimicrobiales bacterium]|nr:alpha/beta fold hydrolase [Acidimicrobiales bacterium]
MATPRPRVVLVHGAIERGRGFDEVVTWLNDLDVLTYDRRGHGERWKEGTASLEEDVDELVGMLAKQPATVVGHSLGGLVVLGASLQRPDLTEAVALYETAIPWGDWWTEDARATMLAEIDRNAASAREGT